jgi:hypothetical protein
MKRWLSIAAVALLTLGAFAWFNAPAMARDYHPRHVPTAVACRPAPRWGKAVRHAHHVRKAVHVRAWHHAAHRR